MINNIFNVITNEVDSAIMNLGDSINVAMRSVSKSAGGFTPIGDFYCSMDGEGNIFIDPDVGDTQSVV